MNETDEQIVATCEAAVTILSEKGRTTRTFQNGTGRVCLGGALMLAQVNAKHVLDVSRSHWRELRECPAVVAVKDTIEDRQGWQGRYPTDASINVIAGFNDRADTTDADVIEVLNETIKRYSDETV